MRCSNPTQATFSIKENGKKDLSFTDSIYLSNRFVEGKLPTHLENKKTGKLNPVMSVPCGKCMPCRLEHSRINALRCTHEARMFEENCFITLTYSEDNLKKECDLTDGGYSLDRKHIQDFMKRLRVKFDRDYEIKIRAFGCGEYGDKKGRPHYHLCLFNCDFKDRVYEGGHDGFNYYSSKLLESLWKFGFSSVCDFSFETAAYVARYCTKKINGKAAENHYRGRIPEFPIYPSRGGGLGKPWFDKYGKTDVIPTDSCIARYVKCGVPKYYDKLRERFDPEGLAKAKKLRSEKALFHVDDNTYERLRCKERCMDAKIKCLVRRLEV